MKTLLATVLSIMLTATLAMASGDYYQSDDDPVLILKEGSCLTRLNADGTPVHNKEIVGLPMKEGMYMFRPVHVVFGNCLYNGRDYEVQIIYEINLLYRYSFTEDGVTYLYEYNFDSAVYELME